MNSQSLVMAQAARRMCSRSARFDEGFTLHAATRAGAMNDSGSVDGKTIVAADY